ncbi:hypothetical protein VNI00_001231 [Paramarasmius palmivorus]|uniref:Uncharacterized protein n=1 Tax=Paramarasmius palmivorus TaxID=297713 RepID=A0AAW0E983_9AGAR
MHGWLAKMRGTLMGDERLRSQGMREMREAKALRKYEKTNKKKNAFRPQRQSNGIFSFFGSSSKKPARRPTTVHRSSTSASKRPQPVSRHSSRSTPHRGPSKSSRGTQPQRSSTRRSAHRGGAGPQARVQGRPSVRR